MLNLIAKAGRKFASELITSSEANKPEAYIDRIKREFQLPEYADALVRYYSNPAYWKKLYGDDPLNSPNRPVPKEAMRPPEGGSYLDAPASGDPVYRGFPRLPDFHYQLQMPSPVDSFDTRFGKQGAIPNPPASFDDRFGKWGSAPAADPRDSFNNRFGSWGSVPAAVSGDTGSPLLRALEKYRRSETSGGPAMASAQEAVPATPALQPDIVSTGGVLGKFREARLAAPMAASPSSVLPLPGATAQNPANEESAFASRSENAPDATPRTDMYPRLRSRIVNSAFPGLTAGDLDQPMPPRDDEREQADLQALEAKLMSSGNINDAMALYNARKLIRR
jgi:hypothetical protein